VPSCLLEPIWSEFSARLPDQPTFHPDHPLGCHRRRIPDRVVFDHVVAALVHGSGDERLAGPGCSDRTIRRRLAQWAAAGLAERLHALTLRAYDQVIGLKLASVAVDGWTTKAPGGGEVAGRSPVDRGKKGRKRSVATDGPGSRWARSPPAPTTTTRLGGGRSSPARPCPAGSPWTAAAARTGVRAPPR
jgi:hypothetical protein